MASIEFFAAGIELMALAERLFTEFPKYPTISSIIRLVISCRTHRDAEENQATTQDGCNSPERCTLPGSTQQRILVVLLKTSQTVVQHPLAGNAGSCFGGFILSTLPFKAGESPVYQKRPVLTGIRTLFWYEPLTSARLVRCWEAL